MLIAMFLYLYCFCQFIQYSIDVGEVGIHGNPSHNFNQHIYHEIRQPFLSINTSQQPPLQSHLRQHHRNVQNIPVNINTSSKPHLHYNNGQDLTYIICLSTAGKGHRLRPCCGGASYTTKLHSILSIFCLVLPRCTQQIADPAEMLCLIMMRGT